MKKQKVMENTKNFAVINKEHFYKIKRKDGVTLVALVITKIFSYDKEIKYSNSKGFLLA